MDVLKYLIWLNLPFNRNDLVIYAERIGERTEFNQRARTEQQNSGVSAMTD